MSGRWVVRVVRFDGVRSVSTDYVAADSGAARELAIAFRCLGHSTTVVEGGAK